MSHTLPPPSPLQKKQNKNKSKKTKKIQTLYLNGVNLIVCVRSGKVKHSYELQRNKFRSGMRVISEFRFTRYEFKFTSSEFNSTSCEFKSTSYEFKSTN